MLGGLRVDATDNDADDVLALMVALADHKAGRIRLLYICTVSQRNLQRGQNVQHLCALMGVSNMPVFFSSRCEAKALDGRPLDRCVDLWRYVRHGGKYQPAPGVVNVATAHPAKTKITPMVLSFGEQSVQDQQSILRKHASVRVLVIGPGVDPELWAPIVSHMECVVVQGGYRDDKSFNVQGDSESSDAIWNCGAAVLCVDKTIAYKTRLSRPQFKSLCEAAAVHQRDFQLLVQLGVMEFRDAARNLFNCLNFAVSNPGSKPVMLGAVEFDPDNAAHVELREVLTCSSFECQWIDCLKQLPPLYDITAYLLLRDTGPVQDPQNRWYEVGQVAKKAWQVLHVHKPETYMREVFKELRRAVDSMAPPVSPTGS